MFSWFDLYQTLYSFAGLSDLTFIAFFGHLSKPQHLKFTASQCFKVCTVNNAETNQPYCLSLKTSICQSLFYWCQKSYYWTGLKNSALASFNAHSSFQSECTKNRRHNTLRFALASACTFLCGSKKWTWGMSKLGARLISGLSPIRKLILPKPSWSTRIMWFTQWRFFKRTVFA